MHRENKSRADISLSLVWEKSYKTEVSISIQILVPLLSDIRFFLELLWILTKWETDVDALSVLHRCKAQAGASFASWFTLFLSDITDPGDWRLNPGQELSCPCPCLFPFLYRSSLCSTYRQSVSGLFFWERGSHHVGRGSECVRLSCIAPLVRSILREESKAYLCVRSCKMFTYTGNTMQSLIWVF